MTFQEYVALFETLADAIAFETQVLSIGRSLLPPCAINVLDGNTATPDYWTWLAGQVEA
jgi:hypothetical protein